jgi:hypothetical protein
MLKAVSGRRATPILQCPGFEHLVPYSISGSLPSPAFLGTGANTAIFSVLNAMLLRAMPFRDPQRLVMVWEANPALDSLVAARWR